jgi:putative SOS response-associated peptidase YedK
MKWGMEIPKIQELVINGRFEELFVKPFFKGLLARKRCVIMFNGYYEWNEKTKTPYLILPHKAADKEEVGPNNVF